jgi:hypothetical protein
VLLDTLAYLREKISIHVDSGEQVESVNFVRVSTKIAKNKNTKKEKTEKNQNKNKNRKNTKKVLKTQKNSGNVQSPLDCRTYDAMTTFQIAVVILYPLEDMAAF